MDSRKRRIESATSKIRPSSFLEYRMYLRTLYNHIKSENEDYTYQMFATDLGLSATNVFNQIVNGSRRLSAKAANQLVPKLGLKNEERRYFLCLVDHNNATSPQDREALFQKLVEIKRATSEVSEIERKYLDFLSAWQHPVLRELVGSPEFREDAEWIIERLRLHLRPEQVRKSLALLEELGLITRDVSTGKLKQNEPIFSTGHETQGMGVIRYHQEMMEIAKEALSEVPEQQRDISALTLRVTPEVAAQIKATLHEFQTKLLDLAASCTDGKEVVQLNMQFFPFTVFKEKESKR